MILDTYFDVEHLTELYNKRLSNSNAKGIDKMNSLSFKKNLEQEIAIIHRKVLSGAYLFSPYIETLKLKGRNKIPRIISIPTLRDRIVLLTLKEILHEIFPENVSRKLPNSYIRDIKKYLLIPSGNHSFVKLDIEKFYVSINRSILIEKLNKKKVDHRIISLIEQAISTPSIPVNTRKSKYNSFITEKGVPQGLSISNVLAQIYLNELDAIIDKRQYFYRRYVDDILILNDSAISNFRYNNIKKVLDEVDLFLNDEKTEKGLTANGFTYLGYKISTNNISIADANVELFVRRMAGKFTWFKNGLHNKNRRPTWLVEDDRFKEVFIEELNEAITGIISTSKNYGWLFYFSEMNDESLLFKIDKIIANFFVTLEIFDLRAPKNLKRISRAYKVIKHKGNKNYISNYDDYDSIRKKRNYLIFRGKIDPDLIYTDSLVESLFEKFRTKQIKKIEKDIGYSYI